MTSQSFLGADGISLSSGPEVYGGQRSGCSADVWRPAPPGPAPCPSVSSSTGVVWTENPRNFPRPVAEQLESYHKFMLLAPVCTPGWKSELQAAVGKPSLEIPRTRAPGAVPT